MVTKTAALPGFCGPHFQSWKTWALLPGTATSDCEVVEEEALYRTIQVPTIKWAYALCPWPLTDHCKRGSNNATRVKDCSNTTTAAIAAAAAAAAANTAAITATPTMTAITPDITAAAAAIISANFTVAT